MSSLGRCSAIAPAVVFCVSIPGLVSGQPPRPGSDSPAARPCVARIHVARFDQGVLHPNALAPSMKTWWTANAQSRALGLCLATSIDDADYVIVLQNTSLRVIDRYDAPSVSTFMPAASVQSTAASVTGDFPSASVYMSSERRPGSWVERLTIVTVYRLQPSREPASWVPGVPSLVAARTGRWPWSKPERAAFADAITTLADSFK